MDWIIQKAEEFCEGVTDGTHDSPKAVEYGRYLITSKHLGEYEIDFSSAKMISEEDYKKVVARSKVGQWDILFSMIGTIGNTYLEKNEVVEYACKNMGIFQMGGDQEKAYWLYYYLKSPQAYEYISSQLRGSTQQYVPLGGLREFPIPVPDITIRRKIVEVLKTIDEKIDTNIKINRNLQEQAQAIFSKLYWEATSQSNFKSMINVLGGGTPKTGTESFWNGEIPFFTPKDVGAPYTFETEKTITDDGLAHCNSRLYPVNTTFVTARGTVGKVALAGVPMAMNQSCYALASDVLPALMVYFYSLEVVKSLKHKASGAVFDAIVTRDFDSEIIRVLGNAEQADFMDIAGPAFEQIHKNTMENQRLQTLRDGLLPKLMSGEVDVSDIDI